MALTNKLEAIAAAIRDKTGKTDKLTLDQMPAEIESISGGGGLEPVEFTDNISYLDYNGIWDPILTKYQSSISTRNIVTAEYAFSRSTGENPPIPILNLRAAGTSSRSAGCNCNYMFYYCKYLRALPTFVGGISNFNSIFSHCESLTEINSQNFVNASFIDAQTSSTGSQAFAYCYSLLHIDPVLLKQLYTGGTGYSAVYYYLFNACYVLSELIGVPVIKADDRYETVTSNSFMYTLNECFRLGRFVFDTHEDDTVKTVKWKNQTLDLTPVGYCIAADSNITSRSAIHGITKSDKVTDAASYEALKNTDNWWTSDINYCRYNHDSAVETINSLPDASEYLATTDGTNTIKFNGAAGALTDGGGINTLTDAEKAVAAAKGWTVTIV